MYIAGLSYAGATSRPCGTGHVSDGGGGDAANESPSYFRTISSISHSSLAAAYQTMKERDVHMVPVDLPLPGKPSEEPSAAEGVISSGVSIPAALSAYAEVIDDSATEG